MKPGKPPVPWVINNLFSRMKIYRENKFMFPHKLHHVESLFLFNRIWGERIGKITVEIVSVCIISCRRSNCVAASISAIGVCQRVYPYTKIIHKVFHPAADRVIFKKIICQVKHQYKTSGFVTVRSEEHTSELQSR